VFEPFMREVVKRPEFASAPAELLSFIHSDAAEVSEAPFVELLAEAPGDDPALWQRQRRALQMLEWIAAPAVLEALAETLLSHPSEELQAWARERRAAKTRAARITPNGAVEVFLIDGGRFQMGSPATDSDALEGEQPQHPVTVPPFYLGKYPVTNEEYARFL
jgi:formylglycine-generating enzyme required for sulfatase activity